MRFVFVFVIYFFIYVQLLRVVDVFICWSIIVCIIIVSITVVFMLSLLVSLLYYIVSIATAISIIITSIVIDGIESRCTQFQLIEDETTVSFEVLLRFISGSADEAQREFESVASASADQFCLWCLFLPLHQRARECFVIRFPCRCDCSVGFRDGSFRRTQTIAKFGVKAECLLIQIEWRKRSEEKG